MGRRLTRSSRSPMSSFLVVVTLIFIISLKNMVVAAVRGWSLSPKEVLLLATIDVLFMFIIAWALSKEHGVASTMVDGD